MAEIIKKEVIKIKNGDLTKLCKNYGTTINKLCKELKLNPDLLYKFDRGEKTIKWEVWEKLTNNLLNNVEYKKEL